MVRPDRVELPTFWFVASPNSKRRERRALDAPKASTYPLVSTADSAVHCRLVLQLSALLLSVGSHRIQDGEVSFERNIETLLEGFMRERRPLDAPKASIYELVSTADWGGHCRADQWISGGLR